MWNEHSPSHISLQLLHKFWVKGQWCFNAITQKNKGGKQKHPDWSPEAESNDDKEALLEIAHNWSLLITRHYLEAKNKLIAQKIFLCGKLCNAPSQGVASTLKSEGVSYSCRLHYRHTQKTIETILKDECCDYSICFKTRISWVLTWNSIIPVDTGKTPNFYSSRKQKTEHFAFFSKSGQEHHCSKFQLTIQMEQGIWVRKCYRYPEYLFWKFLFTWKNNKTWARLPFISGMGILTFCF